MATSVYPAPSSASLIAATWPSIIPLGQTTCAPAFGDRSTYQQDPAADDAAREVAADIAEGADIVMVKPALPYLDVVAAVAAAVTVPVAAYCVSGEYSMVEAAAAQGWLDRERVIVETLTAIRRAGASIILSYWATEASRSLLG